MSIIDADQAELRRFREELEKQYEQVKSKNLKLDMSRGKPGPVQLDLSMDMINMPITSADAVCNTGVDTRNYGLLEGIPEARKLMAGILGMPADQVILGGTSSLNLMYDFISKGMTHGFLGEAPWSKQGEIKFLCPSPGYDRHFFITESFGIKLIPVAMTEAGPDMDEVKRFVADPSVKGIWCVPKYSNPDGITYSDETVRQFAALRPAAKDFRIMWDNAYAVHHLNGEGDLLLNLYEECLKNGTEDLVAEFCSTSKISFPGGGISAMGLSKNNYKYILDLMGVQTICYDKVNQLRHARFFKDADGIREHMKKHAAVLRPKFDVVCDTLDRELVPEGFGHYHRPNGGYFVSFYTLDGCAKRTVQLCREAGVVMTPAGASYPYGNDPSDSNIRIAPTFPSTEELEAAMQLFCLCVKLASTEKLLGE